MTVADASPLDGLDGLDGLDALVTARDRTLVMGILNATPDSFSDGGASADVDDAITNGLALLAAGADIVDLGGESTRPGATRVTPEEEQRRILPVVRALARAGAVLSIDTMNASTAAAALDAGARIINDVSGGLADPTMLAVVADRDAPYISSHWRGHSDVMVSRAVYGDVVAEVADELGERADAALAAGIRDERLILDPGLGFAKDSAHNWAILAHLDRFDALGFPLLIGASRKRFLALDRQSDAPPQSRDLATAVVSALSAQHGVWGVRVHDVASTATALAVQARWKEARG